MQYRLLEFKEGEGAKGCSGVGLKTPQRRPLTLETHHTGVWEVSLILLASILLAHQGPGALLRAGETKMLSDDTAPALHGLTVQEYQHVISV